MKQIVSGGLYRLFFMFFNFLIGLLIAYLAGPDVFGMISIMIVNASAFLIISGLGTESSIMWHAAQNKLLINKLVTFTIGSASFQILLFLFVGIGFEIFFKQTILTGQHSSKYFWLECFYIVGIVLVDKYTSLLYGHHLSSICNQLLVTTSLFLLTVLVLMYFNIHLLNLDPFTFYCLSPCLQATALILYFHRLKSFKFSTFTKADLKSLFNFSIIVFIANTIQFFAYRADYWIILHYSNNANVGIYSQANRFAQLLWVIPNIIAALLIPVIASPQKKMDDNIFAKFIRVVVATGILTVFVVICASWLLYKFFLPPAFLSGFQALIYMLPGVYFFSVNILLAAWFSAKRLLWVNLVASSICFIVIFVMDIILVPKIGIIGAAIANSGAYSFTTIFTIYLFCKYSNLRVKDLFLLRKEDVLKIIRFKFS